MKADSHGWLLPLFPLYGALFLFGTETFLVSPILPIIALDFKVAISQAAYVIAAYVLVYALAAPPLAYAADRIGHRQALIAGLSFFLAGNFIAAHAPQLFLLVAARAVSGLGGALAGPAIWALIVGSVPDTARSRAIGIGMASFSLGQVAGVPIGGFVAAAFGWRIVFTIIAFLAALALLGGVFAKVGAMPPVDARRTGRPHGLLAPWGRMRTALMLVTTILFQAANLGAYSYLGAMLATRFSFETKDLGTIGIAVGIGSIIGSILAGRLGDRARERGTMEGGRLPLWSALLVASFLIESWSVFPVVAVASVFMWFVASGAFVTDSQAFLTGALPEAKALASAWNTTSMYAGTAAGVFLFGHVTNSWAGFFHVASIVASLSIFSALALIVQEWRKGSKAASP